MAKSELAVLADEFRYTPNMRVAKSAFQWIYVWIFPTPGVTRYAC